MDFLTSKPKSHENNSGDHFLSISDLMSGLVLILCLMVIVFAAQQEKSRLKLEELYKQLQMEAADFESYQKMKEHLEEVERKNEEMRAKLVEVEELLKRLRVVRQNVVLGLTEAFKAQNIDAEVDPQTGDVSIQESLLFPRASHKLTVQGRAFLERLLPTYYKVIFSKPTYTDAIMNIIIEGHASRTGDSGLNMRLSVLRSSQVYLFARDRLGYHIDHPMTKKLLIAGRGEIDADQSEERSADRKVLFRFRFKLDDQVMEALKKF